jgi:hypothetical protein
MKRRKLIIRVLWVGPLGLAGCLTQPFSPSEKNPRTPEPPALTSVMPSQVAHDSVTIKAEPSPGRLQH